MKMETEPCKHYGDEIVSLELISQHLLEGLNGTTVEQLAQAKSFFPTFWVMLLCRSVDIFLTYLTELLGLIYKTRPEALRSNEKLSYEEILSCQNFDELVHVMIEERVDSLSYKGFSKLHNDIQEKLGLVLFETNVGFSKANLIVELRNVFVHNRGMISRRFQERVPNHPAQIGEQIIPVPVEMLGHSIFLLDSVMDIDARAIAKFGLPNQPRVPRPSIPSLPHFTFTKFTS